MTEEFEEKEVSGMDVLKIVVDECEQQTEKSPCECIMEKVKLMTG